MLFLGDESQSNSIGSINVPATETETIPQVVSECQEKNVEEHGPAPFVEPPVVLPNETGTFKTPLQLPRNENESSGLPAGKARRFKVAPRLNALRNVHKFQVGFLYKLNYFNFYLIKCDVCAYLGMRGKAKQA